MELNLMNYDILNTVLADELYGPIYRIQTHASSKLSGTKITTILRVDGGTDDKLTATIRWNVLSSPTVEMADEKLKVPFARFLTKTSRFSSSRCIRGANGEIYKWKIGDSLHPKLELYDSEKHLVAKLRRDINPNHLYKPGNLRFEVAGRESLGESRETLDVIIVAFVILRRKEQQESNFVMQDA